MNPDHRPTVPEPHRVEWVPSSPEQIEVRVLGAWQGSTVPPAAVLVVAGERADALAEPPAHGSPPAWGAAFLVAASARPAVEAGEAVLEVAGVRVDLPAGAPGRLAPEPLGEGGTLVDPAVLAERRARRAELAEESASVRAATAEQTAETLRAQLTTLEERLERAAGERDAMAARVADAERRLRLARQREDAERRRRGEVEEEAAAARREAEERLVELRERLASAEEVAEALERELTTARRRAEAAQAAAEQERLARAGLEARLAEAAHEREAAERRAEDAERRADGAERRVEEAERRASQAAQAPVPAPDPADRGRERELAGRIAELQDELARRTTVQERVQDAVRAVREELLAVREEVDETRSDVPGLRARVDELERRRAELEALVAARDAELAAAREALARAESAGQEARAAVEARLHALAGDVADLREGFRASVERLERELGAERARREEAERLLGELVHEPRPAATPPVDPSPAASDPLAPVAAEPAASTGDHALDALIAGLREQVASAREQLEAWDLAAERPAAEPSAPAPEPGPAGGPPPITAAEPARPPVAPADERTRERLRAIEADLRAATPAEDDPLPARRVIESLQEAAQRLRAAAESELADGTAAGTAATAEDDPAVAEAGPRTPLAPRRAGPGRERAWLRASLERLAATDPAEAAELFVALLPAQATLPERLTYAISAPALGTVRVALEPGAARVDRDVDAAHADARLSGTLEALAPLAAGGAGWRLGGVRVEGARRGVRRLVRARRRPVGLDDLRLVSPPPHPRSLLVALAAAVEPGWTTGHRFGVSYAVAGAGRWTVLAREGLPLRVAENGGGHPHAATVELSEDAVLPVLLGAALPAGATASVVGEARAVDVLHGWFDRARGVAGG